MSKPRKPFITPRTALFDKTCRPGARSAEIGAGEQCLILSVEPFSEQGRGGARVDLSWEERAPLLVTAPLSFVAVPTYHFGHSTGRDYLLVLPLVEALARIQRLYDGVEVNADTHGLVRQALVDAGLYARDLDDTEGGE